jgi:hypothetical protein
MELDSEKMEALRRSIGDKFWTYATFPSMNRYLSHMVTTAQKREEEQFKRAYLGEWEINNHWIDKNPNEGKLTKEKFKEIVDHFEKLDRTRLTSTNYNVVDELTKNNNVEEKQMNVCEFKLGNVSVVKNELDLLESGEVIILAPGYTNEDFTVNEFVDKVTVVIKLKDGTYKEYVFELDTDYELATLKRNVRNGVFRLKATYTLESNVEIDEEL